MKDEGGRMKKAHQLLTPETSTSIPPPSKRLGQNFIINQGIISQIIEALSPRADETIVEIGPGRGALTAPLVERTGLLVAVEFDRKLIPFLTDTFGSRSNFKLVQSDALTTDVCEII